MNIKTEENKIVPLTSDIVFKSVLTRNEKVLIKMIKDIFEIEDIDKPFTIVGYETVSPKSGGKIASYIYTFCNIYLARRRELVYDIGIRKLPKVVR